MAKFTQGHAKRGGRSKGTKNKATIEKELRDATLIEVAKTEGITPLEVMLAAMRQAWDAKQTAEAHKYAVDAAPYLHPRLATTTLEGGEKPIETKVTFTWHQPGASSTSP